MATEPTINQVFGSEASLQTIGGKKYFCISLADLESVTQDILGDSPNAEELLAAILVSAATTLTVAGRDGDVYSGLSPTSPNQTGDSLKIQGWVSFLSPTYVLQGFWL